MLVKKQDDGADGVDGDGDDREIRRVLNGGEQEEESDGGSSSTRTHSLEAGVELRSVDWTQQQQQRRSQYEELEDGYEEERRRVTDAAVVEDVADDVETASSSKKTKPRERLFDNDGGDGGGGGSSSTPQGPGEGGEPQVTPLPKMLMFVICCLMLSDGFAITMLFPFVVWMVIDLGVATNERDAGFYAGILASAFSFAQFLSRFHSLLLTDLNPITTDLMR